MIDFEDDFDEILSTDDFGIVFNFNNKQYSGIFNKEHFVQDVGQNGQGSSENVLTMKGNVVIPRETILVLSGENYQVFDCQYDGRGMTEVFVHAV